MTAFTRGAAEQDRSFPAQSATGCGDGELPRTGTRISPAQPRVWSGACNCGEFDVRINPVVSLFAASLIVFLPAHAMAQTAGPDGAGAVREESVSVRDRERPEYAPLGVRLGGFNLNGTLDLGVTSTDNLFAAESGLENDDLIYTAAANARLESDWSRHMIAFEAAAGFRGHEDFSNEDADTHAVRALGRLDIGSTTNIDASIRSAHQVSPRADPDTPEIGNPVEYDRTDVALGVTHRFARFRVAADVLHSEYDYEGGQSFRDNEQDRLRGRIDAEISPRLGVFVEGTVDERDYGNTPALSSEGHTALVGATINTDLMRGEVAVGQFARDYDTGTDFDGMAVSGQLEWYVTQLTTVTFEANRNAGSQISATAGVPYITTEFGARVDHELRRNVILTAGVRVGDRDFDAFPREDEFKEFDIGVDYFLNRRVALHARAAHDEADSSGAMATRDFEVNTVSFGVSLRL